MQKIRKSSKPILCVLLSLVMVLALLPVVPLAAEASAGHELDLSDPPAHGGVWEVEQGRIVYTGEGPLTIIGSNADNPFGVRVTRATLVYIEDDTTISASETSALSLPANSTLYGRGSNIFISTTSDYSFDAAISADTHDDLTISGTIGDITSTGVGIQSLFAEEHGAMPDGGVINISGTIGNITADVAGIFGGNINISGSVGNITSETGMAALFNINISGSVGNIIGEGGDFDVGIDALLEDVIVTETGSVGSISNVRTGIAAGDSSIRLDGSIGDISASFRAVNSFHQEPAENVGIFINTSITASGGDMAFGQQPIIGIPHTATWSDNVTGLPIAGSGSPYVWSVNHRWVSIEEAEDPTENIGWQQDGDGNWRYNLADGIFATGWRQIAGIWYHFTDDGMMQTGWQLIDGVWYYFSSTGAMRTGWQLIDGDWYYFHPGGAMRTGWGHIDGVWYYFHPSGAMRTGWGFIGYVWYFFHHSGAVLTGWQSIDGVWYFFSPGGAMVTGWHFVDGVWHLFEDSGAWLRQR